MAYVKLDPNDAWMEDKGFDKMLKKFKRKCDNEGILKDFRKKEFYMSPSQKRRKKKEEAARRRLAQERKRLLRERGRD